MADGRRKNGGHSTKGKAGRKPKADEIKKIEMMDSVLPPIEAWQALSEKVMEGDTPAIKAWIEHRFGKAKESHDVTSNGETLKQFDIHAIITTTDKDE